MSKRELYPTLAKKIIGEKVLLMMNFISFCDGRISLLEIADRLNVPIWDLYDLIEKLEKNSLIHTND
tara:strand:- start:94 stop:294 length:201 start_codon:yes stop_codon:yes gene_type:complete